MILFNQGQQISGFKYYKVKLLIYYKRYSWVILALQSHFEQETADITDYKIILLQINFKYYNNNKRAILMQILVTFQKH